ncbi:alpha/beta hydrolase [Psychrobacter sp.]|uniref:alpha/beta hydrolase n=1 Tax=Psychrobacter sp. TaxID=56811 RepID=UPI0025D08281|nr:alpha/beta hydrolase [Psychrobacter sp.]
MSNKLLIPLFCFIATGCQSITQPPKTTVIDATYQNIPYTPALDDQQTFDIYLPKIQSQNMSSSKIPLVIYIHGGGWKQGANDKLDIAKTKMGLDNFAKTLLNNGYAIVSIEYRLLPKYQSPAQIDDVTSAFNYIYSHAQQYGLDVNRIAVIGESAGGQLAEYLAVTQGKTKIKANVAFYAPADISKLTTYANQNPVCHFLWGTLETLTGKPTNYSFEGELIGGQPYSPEFIRKAKAISPVYLVSENTPPTLLLHGDKDCLVPLKHSEVYYQLLQQHHIPSELVIVKGAGHADSRFYRSTQYLDKVINFLNQYLKP